MLMSAASKCNEKPSHCGSHRRPGDAPGEFGSEPDQYPLIWLEPIFAPAGRSYERQRELARGEAVGVALPPARRVRAGRAHRGAVRGACRRGGRAGRSMGRGRTRAPRADILAVSPRADHGGAREAVRPAARAPDARGDQGARAVGVRRGARARRAPDADLGRRTSARGTGRMAAATCAPRCSASTTAWCRTRA